MERRDAVCGVQLPDSPPPLGHVATCPGQGATNNGTRFEHEGGGSIVR